MVSEGFRTVRLWWVVGLATFAIACARAPQKPDLRGVARTAGTEALGEVPVLAISPTPRGGPPLTPKGVGESLRLARQAGVTGDHLANTWTMLEPSPGSYHVDNLRKPLKVLGETFGWELAVTLSVINTTVKSTPPDLVGEPFDSPRMKKRFRMLIDAVRPYFNRHLRYLAIGNEVDVYLDMHPGQWQAYRNFYEDAAKYVHSVAPWIKVGVTTTFYGASKRSVREVKELNRSSDVVFLTYYPLDPGHLPSGPETPLQDFPRMVALAEGRPLILQEVGWPTASVLGSSDEQQAQFVRNVFKAWHGAGGRAIPFLSYFCMHDFTPKWCDGMAKYWGLADPQGKFRAFLCTLGLRQVSGEPKPGWRAFLENAASLNRARLQALGPKSGSGGAQT